MAEITFDFALAAPYTISIHKGEGRLGAVGAHKKILVSLPEAFLAETDAFLKEEDISRSEFIRRAMQFYLKERRQEKLRLLLERGYREMGEINLEIACACFHADTETTLRYEENLG